ncbi:hypothetical protein EDD28_0879 [Salana multivorans]|uniref:Uncharacterized protein n=1 Tax=Salana multivorans TaxID=120377 RepID=A0A3N2D931_9MICO|nr:hypothetical protein [Salana multivorans]ROR96296.1 hypothetical protein EDD28_0879 [Salana multivorans]
MEFLTYSLGAASVFFVLFRPKRERLAFRLLVAALAIAVVMFMIAVSTSIVPQVNL